MRLHVALSGLPTEIDIPVADLWSSLLPLAVWIWEAATTTPSDATAARRPPGSPFTLGLVGPAGAGKSHLAAVLQVLLNAIGAIELSSVRSAQVVASGADAAPVCAVVGMDAYHFPNTRLLATDVHPDTGDILPVPSGATAAALAEPGRLSLKSFKGRIDTIDVASLARDLACVRRSSPTEVEAECSRIVFFPEYDRAKHDPIPAVVRVDPEHTRVVIVEGLYLLVGAAGEKEEVTPSSDPIATEDWIGCEGSDDGDREVLESAPVPAHPWSTLQRLWARVHDSLDAVWAIDVEGAVSEERVVRRKVSGGQTDADARAYYRRVDAPIRDALARLQRRADAILRFEDEGDGRSCLHSVHVRSTEHAAALASTDPSVATAAATSAHSHSFRALSEPASQPSRVHSDAKPHLLVLGLNPALQRTVVFDALTLGDVNRATDVTVGVGGKGQNAAKAALHWQPNLLVHLVQPLGGWEGRQVESIQRQSIDDERLELANHWLDGPGGSATRATQLPRRSTRVCTTILNRSPLKPVEVTELIEPSPELAPEDATILLRLALEGVDNCAREGQRFGIALVGTVPRGCAPIYDHVARYAKERGGFVLVDGIRDIDTVLLSGSADVLKINAKELAELEGCVGRPSTSNPMHWSGRVPPTATVSRALANASELELGDDSISLAAATVFDAFPALPLLAVTNGARQSFLFERPGMGARQFCIRVARLHDVASPIGAGDTVGRPRPIASGCLSSRPRGWNRIVPNVGMRQFRRWSCASPAPRHTHRSVDRLCDETAETMRNEDDRCTCARTVNFHQLKVPPTPTPSVFAPRRVVRFRSPRLLTPRAAHSHLLRNSLQLQSHPCTSPRIVPLVRSTLRACLCSFHLRLTSSQLPRMAPRCWLQVMPHHPLGSRREPALQPARTQ